MFFGVCDDKTVEGLPMEPGQTLAGLMDALQKKFEAESLPRLATSPIDDFYRFDVKLLLGTPLGAGSRVVVVFSITNIIESPTHIWAIKDRDKEAGEYALLKKKGILKMMSPTDVALLVYRNTRDALRRQEPASTMSIPSISSQLSLTDMARMNPPLAEPPGVEFEYVPRALQASAAPLNANPSADAPQVLLAGSERGGSFLTNSALSQPGLSRMTTSDSYVSRSPGDSPQQRRRDHQSATDLPQFTTASTAAAQPTEPAAFVPSFLKTAPSGADFLFAHAASTGTETGAATTYGQSQHMPSQPRPSLPVPAFTPDAGSASPFTFPPEFVPSYPVPRPEPAPLPPTTTTATAVSTNSPHGSGLGSSGNSPSSSAVAEASPNAHLMTKENVVRALRARDGLTVKEIVLTILGKNLNRDKADRADIDLVKKIVANTKGIRAIDEHALKLQYTVSSL